MANPWQPWQTLKLWAGRLRKNPDRDTTLYPRLMSIGSAGYYRDRPTIKPVPANLRKFAKTVYARRAINVIKMPIVSLPWEIVPKSGIKETSELKRQIEIATACFSHPNNDDSCRTLLEQVIEDYLVCGAGIIEQQPSSNEARPLWMWAVDALSVQIYAGWDGDKSKARYCQTVGYGNVGGAQGINLRNDELIYIRKDPTSETPFGTGPVEIAFASISRQLGVAEFAGNLASNSQPENLLWMQGMQQAQLDAFRLWWRQEIEGQGQTPIIGGTEAKAIKLRGTDDNALYLKYQEFLVREIATAFELSPQRLGVERDVNRNQGETGDEHDWETAIRPCATNIAAHLTREAINGTMGFSQLEFRFKGLDREDEKLQAEIFEIEYRNNAITPDEYRATKGRPAMKNSPWSDKVNADVQIAIKTPGAPIETVVPKRTNED